MTSRKRAWACACASFWLLAATPFATAQDDDRGVSLCGGSTGKICPPVPALGETIHLNFRTRSLGEYINKVNSPLDFDTPQDQGQEGKGLVLLVEDEGSTPMVEVKKYIFFGRIDILIQAAPDPGIVTTLALVSPDGDEINFEWTGADDKTVQTNWFSKGNTSMRDRVGYHPINRSSTAFHAYSISWGTKRIQWSVDDAVVRTLNYRKEDDGTSNGFPQAPMNIRIGCWVAGGRHASPGNLEWSGGAAGFTSGPKRAYIKSLNVTDDAYNITGSQPSQPKFYTWKDLSGFYHNISAMYDNPSTGNGTAGSTPAPLNPNAPVFSGGLGTGGIAGIIVGFVAAFSVIGFLAIVVLAQRRKRAKKEEDDAASAKEMELRNMSVEEVGGVDNKPELDGNVLAEMSGDSDKEAQELDGKWDALFEMSEDNNPQELSPAESHESEEMYYEKLRAAVTGMKKPRDDLPEGKDERSV